MMSKKARKTMARKPGSVKASEIRRKGFDLMIATVAVVSLVAFFFMVTERGVAQTKTLQTAQKITIDVRDTDVRRVLEAFSQQTGLSVVTGKGVTGAVTVRLIDVQWDQALEAILKPNGFGYERTGDILVVLPVEKIQELNASQPLNSRVFILKYIDAGDVKPAVDALLSERGRAQIIEITGQKGWDFGAFGAAGTGQSGARQGTASAGKRPGRRYKGADKRRSKTKTMVVTDIPSVIERIADMIEVIDVKPQQIRIASRFMEINRDRLRDLGVDIATGSSGTSSDTITSVAVDKSGSGTNILTAGGQTLSSLVSPSAFNPLSTGIDATRDFNSGLSLAFKKLTGTQFDVLVHALEEDVNTNTLSAPSIMTMDNQEANILVGTQYPILTSSVAGTTSTTTVTSLDYYQDIGIQLRVVPQIAGDDHINMIIHPAVTSFTTTLSAQNTGGFTSAEYPILITREAETQILMKDGDTIVIGGLMKDVASEGYQRVPFLSSIPILGMAFTRKTNDLEKIELLIFVTAEIHKDEDVADQIPSFVPARPSPKTKIQWQQQSSLPEDEAPQRVLAAAK